MTIPYLGNTLEIENLNYDGYPFPSLIFKWYRDEDLITESTGSKYVVQPEDIGAILQVRIDIENIYGSNFATLITNAVQSEAIPPEFTFEPFMDSDYLPPVENNPVSIIVQANGIPTPLFSFEWFLDGELLKTSGSQYTPSSTDVGGILSARVTATNILGSVSRSITTGDPVRPDQLNGTYVNIIGPVYAGYESSIVSDIYGALSIEYTWQVNDGEGYQNFGTNTSSVNIPEDYVGFDIRCLVTASDSESNLIFTSNVVTVQESVGIIPSSYSPQGTLTPGDGYVTEFVEKGTEINISSADVFASESHPIFHLGHPPIHYMGSSGFTLDMYAFHGSSIRNVILSCNGGESVTAGFEQISGNTGAGYFYFPIDASEFQSGETYEIRATAIPVNGYTRSKNMILTYYGEENKVQIDTTTSIKEAGLQIVNSETYDPTKKNIIELTESGTYDFGSSVVGSLPIDYGILEVIPADGVNAIFDFTTQSRNNNGYLRPGIRQIKFSNITFQNKIGPAAENPDNSNPGVYVEDSESYRWYFEGCTMQGDWYDTGNWLLPCDQSPNREGWFRSSYYQSLFFLNCYAEQCHNSPFSGAKIAKNCISEYIHQDAYTNTVACINCSSINHLTPGCSSFHADHYQLFSPREPYLVENYLLYGYYGNDLVSNIQPFGFFGTGNETYRDIAQVECVWDGASGSSALAQIGLSYDHVVFIGCSLENRGWWFVNRPGNAIGPVLVRGTRGPSIGCAFLHELDYRALLGSTNEFRIEDNIPEVRFTGTPQDDSALNLLYEWHIPSASMASVEDFNMYLLDGDGSNTSWFIGVTAYGPSGPTGIANVFNSNDGSGRFAYSNFWPGPTFSSFSLTNVIDEISALDLEEKEYYVRLITSTGSSISFAGKKRTTNNQVDFSGFNANIFDSVDLVSEDIIDSPTGVTFQVWSPI